MHLDRETILPYGSEFCIDVYGHAMGDNITRSCSINSPCTSPGHSQFSPLHMEWLGDEATVLY